MVVSLETPDASTFTLAASGINAGEDIALTITSNISFSHKVKVDFQGETSGEIDIAAGQTSFLWTVPLGWMNKMQTVTGATGTVRLYTYDGAT